MFTLSYPLSCRALVIVLSCFPPPELTSTLFELQTETLPGDISHRVRDTHSAGDTLKEQAAQIVVRGHSSSSPSLLEGGTPFFLKTFP